MKIAITGHTSGLGKAFYDHLTVNGHEVIGMSRTNGYNVLEKFEEISTIAESCDIFFNNAHAGISQSLFIKRLFRKTMIVTSGSMAANYLETGEDYYKEKYEIEKTHNVCKEFTKIPMLLLKMGYLENHREKTPTPILYSDVIRSVDFWLGNLRISMIEFNNIR